MTSSLHRSVRRSLALALCLFAAASPALAQKGSVAGVVIDAETGETLVGANVVLEGTAVGTTTDLDGRYVLGPLDPGVYDVVYSYIGFSAKTVRSVEVAAGAATRIDVSLAPEAFGMDEVVVEAAAVRNAEAALLRERQKASAVSDAISAEAIGRAGSASASDAMQRVTGASVVAGKYVYVRGLGDRYMNTQLNGASLPSADPDRNAVPLDLFPAGLLDNIVTTKTFTPDKPGSFTGGTVNIGTKAFPERFTFSFSTSAGVNSQTTGASGFLTYDTGGTDWLGIDDGTRGIPAPWAEPGASAPNHVQARRDPEKAAELDRLARAFNAEMAPSTTTGPVESSYSLSVGNQVSFLGRPLGFLGSFSYDRDHASYSDGTAATYLLTGRVTEVDELNLQQHLSDTRSTSDVLWGGLGTISFKPHPNHSVSSTFMYNRSATTEARYLMGEVPRNFAPERRLESRVLAFTERAIRSWQLSGDHVFKSAGGLRADWTGAWMRTLQEEPDVRFFASDFTLYERDGRVDTSFGIAISNYTAPTRYFRDLTEDGWDGGLNLSLPFAAGGMSGVVKTGAALNLRSRTFRERRFEYILRTGYDGDPAAFFSRVGVLDSTVAAGRTTYEIGNYVIDATSPRNNYDGDQQVYAGYGMVELRLSRRLRAVTGVRYERTVLDVASQDATVAAAGIREGDWLPSLNLVYELGRMNLRAAYGKTLARPTFRELAPFTSFAYINAPTVSGNPNLKRTLVHNLDLRWEWFVRPGEIVAVSGFYKRFIDPIERTILNNNFETSFTNVADADVYGVEVEARKRLDDVGLGGALRALRGLEVGANLTLARSKVDIPAAELEEIRALDPNAADTRPLQGQSPYVVNADVTYGAPGTTVSLLYNVFGRRLSDVSLGGTPDLFELPYHSLDLVATQHLLRWLRVRASVRNLLDAEVRQSYPFKGEDYYASVYTRGRSFSVSLTVAY